MREVGLNAIVPTPIPSKYESRTLQSSLPQSWKSGEHAPRTPKVFPRNTQVKKLSKRCLDSGSDHMFCEYSLIYWYFPSSACSIVLECLIVQKHWVCIAPHLVEIHSFFYIRTHLKENWGSKSQKPKKFLRNFAGWNPLDDKKLRTNWASIEM